jgi:hypothetical protein
VAVRQVQIELGGPSTLSGPRMSCETLAGCFVLVALCLKKRCALDVSSEGKHSLAVLNCSLSELVLSNSPFFSEEGFWHAVVLFKLVN